MDRITNKKSVLIDAEDPTPIAYYNVYEEGDIWVKIRGCEDCPLDSRLLCCGGCPMLLKDTGECRLHMGSNKRDKPFHCTVIPTPDICHGWCQLEFECVKGSNEGKIRRVRDVRNVFKEK